MSHFKGLVIMTPKYAKNHDLEDTLAPYSEHIKVGKYSCGEVSVFEKCNFLSVVKGLTLGVLNQLHKDLMSKGIKVSYDQRIMYQYKDGFVEAFKKLYPEVYVDFEAIYKEFGDEWNGNTWELNEKSGKWERMTTRNPRTRYDYYMNESQWFQSKKTKKLVLANHCRLGDIDFNADDSNDWGILNTENLPAAIIIDGEWYEWGEVSWFGAMSDEKSYENWQAEVIGLLKGLPLSSVCHMMDFHI